MEKLLVIKLSEIEGIKDNMLTQIRIAQLQTTDEGYSDEEIGAHSKVATDIILSDLKSKARVVEETRIAELLGRNAQKGIIAQIKAAMDYLSGGEK